MTVPVSGIIALPEISARTLFKSSSKSVTIVAALPIIRRPVPPMNQRRRISITADFPGAACPPRSVISFAGPGGREHQATVTAIRARNARAVDDAGVEWNVPYSLILSVVEAPVPDCTLREIESLAIGLVSSFQASGTLPAGWGFGFDLATSRAGVCRYVERRIDLSVSYCLAATRAEIEDTVLHEIAHAIVGPRHNHDAVWKAKAREIGCTGERCHRVQHSTPKWVGECGCGQQWFRQILQRRIMRNRACSKCDGVIKWRRNTDAVG